jgi:ATP-dependent RNA helicase DDX24/MAK5
MPAKAKSGRPKPQAKASKATGWRKVDVASDALRFSSMGGFFSLEELDGDAEGSIRWDVAKVSAVPDDASDDAPDDAPGSEPAPDDAPAPEPAADAKPARKRKRKTKQPAEEPPAEERLPWAPPPKGQNKRAATERDAVAARAPTAVEPAEAVHEAEGEAAPVAEADMEETDMSSWSQLGLHPELLARLAERGFARPTPIQEACLPPALHGRRDIVGAAETGSGKTLAFGLPILQRWLETRDTGEAREGLFGLIITPTRELALQVADHLRALMPRPDASCARVVTLVGGMAVVKQKRQLQERPWPSP